MAKKDAAITDFFFELGMMKKIEHCGTKFAGVKHPDTLAEHTCRSAQIGFALAIEERGNPEKVAAMCMMHDIGEIRVGDAHRIAQKYFDVRPAEKKAVYDQTAALPPLVRSRLRALWDEFNAQNTVDGIIARDSDLLETMMQAKEYLDTGYTAMQRWLTNGHKFLKTRTAKKWFKKMVNSKFTDWWNNLNTV